MAVVRTIVYPFIEQKGVDRVALWWQEVEIALAAGRVSRARRFLRWILAARPDDETAWLRLADLASSHPARVAYLSRAYAFHPQSRRVQEALREARVRQLEAHGGKLARRGLALCRLPSKTDGVLATLPSPLEVGTPLPGKRVAVQSRPAERNRRIPKIAATVACALLCMTLLPTLALPTSGRGWLGSEPAARNGTAVPLSTAAASVPGLPDLLRLSGTDLIAASEAAPPRPLVARVNGRGIGLEAMQRRMAELLSSMAISGADLQGEAVQARLPALRRQVLGELIDEVLVQQAAQEFGIAVPGPEVSGAVRDRVTAGIDDTPEMVHARQIVLANKQDAWQVLVRLADGEAFTRLAEERSLDRQTRDQGGDLGWLPRGAGWIAPEVEASAFVGQPGQIRGPVHVGDRYIILQILAYDPDRPLDPDALEMLQARDFEQWLAGRRAAAGIEILVDLDLPAPEAGQERGIATRSRLPAPRTPAAP